MVRFFLGFVVLQALLFGRAEIDVVDVGHTGAAFLGFVQRFVLRKDDVGKRLHANLPPLQGFHVELLDLLADLVVGDFVFINQRRFADRKIVFRRERHEIELARIFDIARLADVFYIEIATIRLAIPFDRGDDFAGRLLARLFGDRLSQPSEDLIAHFRQRLEFPLFGGSCLSSRLGGFLFGGGGFVFTGLRVRGFLGWRRRGRRSFG